MTVEKSDKEPEPKEEASASASEAGESSKEEQARPKSTRETILAAIEETKRKASEKEARPKEEPKPKEEPEATEAASKKGAAKIEAESEAAPPEKQADKPAREERKDSKERDESQPDGDQAEKPQASKAPAAWSKSSKAQWDSLPPSIQEEVLRREANASKGVEELKSRHQTDVNALRARTEDLENAVAPYRDAIRQAGRTDGQVVDQLFKWHMALSGPNKAQAFQALARNFGVDVSTLAGGGAQGASNGSGAANPPAPDLSWMPAIDNVARRLEQFEQQTAAQQQAHAQKTVESWAKDKPHFERVRGRMAQLINMDADLLQRGQPAINGFIRGDDIDMDAAYEAAMWADPELRSELLREQQERSEAAAQQAAEKLRLEAEVRLRTEKAKAETERAKRAAMSLKPGAPVSGVNGAALPGRPNTREESVRESIRRALQGG